MGLEPAISFPVIYDEQIQPSRTYSFDMETGEIGPQIDGYAAIVQFITKAVHTIRYQSPIYSGDYGCEIQNLLGRGFSERFIKAGIIRMIREALIYDDRIERVYDFEMEPVGDDIFITFKVDTVEGMVNYKGLI